MMKFINDMMWAYCRLMGNVCTAIGLTGLLAFAGHGLVWAFDKITNEE